MLMSMRGPKENCHQTCFCNSLALHCFSLSILCAFRTERNEFKYEHPDHVVTLSSAMRTVPKKSN